MPTFTGNNLQIRITQNLNDLTGSTFAGSVISYPLSLTYNYSNELQRISGVGERFSTSIEEGNINIVGSLEKYWSDFTEDSWLSFDPEQEAPKWYLGIFPQGPASRYEDYYIFENVTFGKSAKTSYLGAERKTNNLTFIAGNMWKGEPRSKEPSTISIDPLHYIGETFQYSSWSFNSTSLYPFYNPNTGYYYFFFQWPDYNDIIYMVSADGITWEGYYGIDTLIESSIVVNYYFDGTYLHIAWKQDNYNPTQLYYVRISFSGKYPTKDGEFSSGVSAYRGLYDNTVFSIDGYPYIVYRDPSYKFQVIKSSLNNGWFLLEDGYPKQVNSVETIQAYQSRAVVLPDNNYVIITLTDFNGLHVSQWNGSSFDVTVDADFPTGDGTQAAPVWITGKLRCILKGDKIAIYGLTKRQIYDTVSKSFVSSLEYNAPDAHDVINLNTNEIGYIYNIGDDVYFRKDNLTTMSEPELIRSLGSGNWSFITNKYEDGVHYFGLFVDTQGTYHPSWPGGTYDVSTYFHYGNINRVVL